MKSLTFVFVLIVAVAMTACDETTNPVPQVATSTPDVAATVAASVQATLEAQPTASPILTPEPTHTPLPTVTSTPVPTQTSTPIPTRTPRPTATPDPLSALFMKVRDINCELLADALVERYKNTEHAILRFSGLEEILRSSDELNCRGLIELRNGITGTAVFYRNADSYGMRDPIPSEWDCELLAERIKRNSKERYQGTLGTWVLKIYDIREMHNSSARFECSGTAKLSKGGERDIIFYAEEDGDGDRFTGWRLE